MIPLIESLFCHWGPPKKRDHQAKEMQSLRLPGQVIEQANSTITQPLKKEVVFVKQSEETR